MPQINDLSAAHAEMPAVPQASGHSGLLDAVHLITTPTPFMLKASAPVAPNHAAAPSPLVEIDNVDFAYGKRAILKGISLSVPKGRLVAIMGGSGCGKTTLLRLIGGQLMASKGMVRVDGQDVSKLTRDGLYEMRRKMGMLFQFGALFTDMSVFDNIAFQLREHTALPEEMIRDLVLMKLNAVGLRGAAKLQPSELSGGMARRVALARAVALDPMLIMYDEPFAGLDPISLAVVGKTIRKLNDALGATSILVTHDVVESLQIVDYLYFISDGRIVGQGTPDEIRASSEPYIKQFVHAEMDGPVPFHYAASPYTDDLGLTVPRART
jgi:phospholipid/cholesterol/gamma-HCH transport system ATP-binding protein